MCSKNTKPDLIWLFMKRVIKSSIKIVSILMLFSFSCQTKNENKTIENNEVTKSISLIKVDSPSNGTLFTAGDNVNLKLKLRDEKITPDSVILFVNDKRVGVINGLQYDLKTDGYKLGSINIRAQGWKDSLFQSTSVSLKLKSNIAPKKYSYKVIKSFNHDPDAYTQGLVYMDGFIYEGTGRNGSSSIRKVELETGKIIQSVNMDQKHFGEGIALFNNKIYQLTWTSGVGFEYDLNTFKQIRTFDFSTQGWGLTTNGKDLIMSDGSNVIHYMEPENFGELKRIEVYDNNGPVDQLNELEYINGDLYANVYQTDKIVIINPETGMVKGEIDFKGLLKASDRTNSVDVLNGIAWDETGKRLFVTGKLWPKLYHVEIVDR